MSRELSLEQLVVNAEATARGAHAGQLDKLGDDYIRHVERVARRVWTPLEMVVAWLHDVVEDTNVTLTALRVHYPEWVVVAVDAITHAANEPRHAYYERVRGNPIALSVKVADIADNTDPRRLLRLPAGEMTRLMKKYADALYMLTDDMTPPSGDTELQDEFIRAGQWARDASRVTSLQPGVNAQ